MNLCISYHDYLIYHIQTHIIWKTTVIYTLIDSMLTIENLTRHVGNNHIINGVDLHIKAGQAIGLVGPNGCGKTSLINLINGFSKPQTGAIILDDKHITKLSVEERSLAGI
jgi:branched-chain amino acid transport system ATP-binding protein